MKKMKEQLTKQRQCCECRKGEHDNYDDDVELCIVRDPDTKKIVLRGYICRGHDMMFREDGYIVK